ncbi:MAG: RNA polymerase sigma factor [bacterium]
MNFNFDETGKTDEELVALTLKDQEYFSFIVKRYSVKLKVYISRISGLGSEDADDLLQEVFIKTYRHLNDFDGNLKFSAWIYRIARNHTISHFRKNKLKQELQLQLDENVMENLSSDFDLEKEINDNMTKDSVQAVLNSLDARYREVLELKFIEGWDYRQISDILKKPMGTVATLINRAKKKFKDQLKKQKIKI